MSTFKDSLPRITDFPRYWQVRLEIAFEGGRPHAVSLPSSLPPTLRESQSLSSIQSSHSISVPPRRGGDHEKNAFVGRQHTPRFESPVPVHAAQASNTRGKTPVSIMKQGKERYQSPASNKKVIIQDLIMTNAESVDNPPGQSEVSQEPRAATKGKTAFQRKSGDMESRERGRKKPYSIEQVRPPSRSPYSQGRRKQLYGKGPNASYLYFESRSSVLLDYPPPIPSDFQLDENSLYVHFVVSEDIEDQTTVSWYWDGEDWISISPGDTHQFNEEGTYVFTINSKHEGCWLALNTYQRRYKNTQRPY
ncbi:hypothetical protein CC1G_09758 [Coprinopsis cinerea okayama7|uniref:Uncharacterized protein n=1 Tax=Coprinopsis cinerea (strain Okayama-7 / 130 / ATCC MYA-4618 / FGSC 9003) TaxID=240176 RepID=A8PE19_COPC7|nr:hypothetical protein CC1G_09758 [Coprinopsis cinerea okayama7\|eukprot:XP_001840707.2 hypothetical protein CC1G_09758 [Coprinopsis cinerea okayama7\